jgi:hypothetical protein
LQNSAAALPASAATERALRKLRREIIDMSGTAVLLSCSVLAGESDVHKAFQAARNDEYEEIVDRCEDFLQQVKKEYTANHFTYAELRRTRSTWSSCATGSPRYGSATCSTRTAGRRREGARRVRAVARGLCRAGVRRGSGGSLTTAHDRSHSPPACNSR